MVGWRISDMKIYCSYDNKYELDDFIGSDMWVKVRTKGKYDRMGTVRWVKILSKHPDPDDDDYSLYTLLLPYGPDATYTEDYFGCNIGLLHPVDVATDEEVTEKLRALFDGV
jgi:hypothetical protein